MKKLFIVVTLSLLSTLLVSCSESSEPVDDTVKPVTLSSEEVHINSIFDDIKEDIPYVITGNTPLFYQYSDVTITYTSTCAVINNNVIIYPFEEENRTCNIEVLFGYNDYSIPKTLEVFFIGISGLQEIPKVYIDTDKKVTRLSGYVTGTLNVLDNESLSDLALSIKVRGNSTYLMPKLSYKIKFDEKVEFFSDYQEKDWVLLANHADHTLIRNALAFSIADALTEEFSPSFTFIDLYINDEYLGNYLLTDQIEVTNDRVDIEENESTVDTGYLLEYDKGIYRDILHLNDHNYFSYDGVTFVLKSPNFEDDHYLDAQKDYIENYMISVMNTLKDKKDYSELIDEQSFIDWYIVNELFNNCDSGYSSIFFYKDSGELLKMGPVWDFDLSLGNCGYKPLEQRGPEELFTSLEEENILFYYLMQYPSFKTHLQERWNQVLNTVLIPSLTDIYTISNSILISSHTNFNKWNVIGVSATWYTTNEIHSLLTYDAEVYYIYHYLEKRIKWLDIEFNSY